MRRTASLLSAVAVIALAACSSSSSSDDGGGSSIKAGEPIVIAGEGSMTGFSGAEEGVEARLARTNKDGGVNGHPIKFLGITDNGGSADKGLSSVRQLVQRDKVDAIVPEFPTVLSPAAAAFLEQQKVPYVGLGYEASMCNNPAGFAFNGCNVPDVATNPQPALVMNLPKTVDAKDLTGKKVAVVGSNASGGASFVKQIADRAKDLNAEIVFTAADIPASTTNVQAFVDPVLSANPDIVFIVADLVADAAVQGTLLANGFKGQMVNAAAYLPGLIDTLPDLAKALDGSWIVSVVPTPLDNSTVSKQIVADFEAAGKKITFGSLIAYLATDLYIALLEKAGGDPDKVIEVGENFTWDQGQGGFKTTWPAARDQTAQCSGMVRFLNNEYTSVAPFTCV
ncbi:ABC transporter substrate-binding protein [Frankia sp. CNm7]|uniref:ABC transporter substrate-binding protein n=2 Tax=Frankia nepalensis TaxID=1836974 RepID=A0A937RBG8_9ACTN|nr:ABC transporter substrate-binding protein [Frankia nepalensis]MBL7511899.1 ABC transporter substrate-binding protein [Frankia nepalensis]MBL7516650.1 ABC transporter substrate-binding protein [Frankia nepalensis]MBL7627380.1 ABC transporter substrate-binding protein [Frankia nepalensis]